MKPTPVQVCMANCIVLSCTIAATPLQAQIIPDSTLPDPSIVEAGCTVCTIEGGTIRETNLFHSFSEFSVPTGGEAFFNNGLAIENIFSRITGDSISNIDGLIRANGTANLFLINPNGLLFGPNAQLDIGGSFIASTADSVIFNNGFSFSGTDPQAPPLLTINTPVGLQYGERVGDIQVQGDGISIGLSENRSLGSIKPGNTIALLGGNVTIEGAVIDSPGGRIEIGGVTNSGSVNLIPVALGFDFDHQEFNDFKSVVISRSFVNSSLARDSNFSNFSSRGGIFIRALQLDITGNSIIRSDTFTEAPGGDIEIEARRFTINGGSSLLARSRGLGSAGNLKITATELVDVAGRSRTGVFPTALSTRAGERDRSISGNGGDLTILTRRLIVRDGATITSSTFTQGNAGDITIRADESVELGGETFIAARVQRGATGEGGELSIETDQLILRGGSVISASTFSTGTAGNISIDAEEFVRISGKTADGRFPSEVSALSRENTGDAGKVRITTGELFIQDGASISTSTAGGRGGDIQINAELLNLGNRASISTETTSNTGGNVQLQIRDLLLLSNESGISTTAGTAQAGGDGGDITIETPNGFIVARENSDITANAFAGNGGNIEITTQSLFGIQPRENLSDLSDITATSELGINGEIDINTPDIDPSQGLVNLPDVPGVPETLQGCPWARGSNSQFINSGRGGLPTVPTDPLESSDILEDIQPPAHWDENSEGSLGEANSTDRIVEATGWMVDENGKVVLVAEMQTGTGNGCRWRSPDFRGQGE